MAVVVGKGYKPKKDRYENPMAAGHPMQASPSMENKPIISDVPLAEPTGRPTSVQGNMYSPNYSNSSVNITGSYKPVYQPNRNGYTPSDRVNSYYEQLTTLEGERPDPFESRYEDEIQSVLDNILNRKPFDINTDKNYNQLYGQYRENYMTQADKAGRDAAANIATLSGGYGSSYAGIVGSQASDNIMQGLNDKNIELMNLAYGMYSDDRADRYNQLGALTGLDNTDYSRYRDEVSDYYNDRNYLASRYGTEYANDYGAYADELANDKWLQQFEYQKQMDAEELALRKEAAAREAEEWALRKQQMQQQIAKGGSRGSGSSRGSSKGSKKNNGELTPLSDFELAVAIRNGADTAEIYDLMNSTYSTTLDDITEEERLQNALYIERQLNHYYDTHPNEYKKKNKK